MNMAHTYYSVEVRPTGKDNRLLVVGRQHFEMGVVDLPISEEVMGGPVYRGIHHDSDIPMSIGDPVGATIQDAVKRTWERLEESRSPEDPAKELTRLVGLWRLGGGDDEAHAIATYIAPYVLGF